MRERQGQDAAEELGLGGGEAVNEASLMLVSSVEE